MAGPLTRFIVTVTRQPMVLRVLSGQTALSGLRSFMTVRVPLDPVIGPTVAVNPPPGITAKPPLPAKPGDGFQLAPGDCSVTTQVAPLGTPTVVAPVPGNMMETGLVTGTGAPPTVQLRLNT